MWRSGADSSRRESFSGRPLKGTDGPAPVKSARRTPQTCSCRGSAYRLRQVMSFPLHYTPSGLGPRGATPSPTTWHASRSPSLIDGLWANIASIPALAFVASRSLQDSRRILPPIRQSWLIRRTRAMFAFTRFTSPVPLTRFIHRLNSPASTHRLNSPLHLTRLNSPASPHPPRLTRLNSPASIHPPQLTRLTSPASPHPPQLTRPHVAATPETLLESELFAAPAPSVHRHETHPPRTFT